jgi:hypothetical protein
MKAIHRGALAALAGLGLCSGCASSNSCGPSWFSRPGLFSHRAPVTDCCPTCPSCGPGAPGGVPFTEGPLLGEPGLGAIGPPGVVAPPVIADPGAGAPIYTQPPAAPDRLLPVPVPQPLPAAPGGPPAAPAPAAPSSRWR